MLISNTSKEGEVVSLETQFPFLTKSISYFPEEEKVFFKGEWGHYCQVSNLLEEQVGKTRHLVVFQNFQFNFVFSCYRAVKILTQKPKGASSHLARGS